jgi:hypothetical protein
MSAHTPGPWHRNIAPATKYNTVWSGRNTHVARVVVDAPMSADEVEANIKLIAAAPELLTACRLIVSAFDALKPASAARNEPLQINAARAAIAKATGEAT